jgi:cyclophilin family peptidyl-prolyl cis-trans isomerase
MRKSMKTLLATTAIATIAGTAEAAAPRVKLTTSMGVIVVELNPEKAPITVKNFLEYVRAKHYDGTVFHRVMRGFMIQGGGFDARLAEKPDRDPIRNEADNGLRNESGTIAMARLPDPHTASAQFFINTANNTMLNHSAKNKDGWGYAVFGVVIEGMDVVKRIEMSPVADIGRMEAVPRKAIVIEKAEIVQ